MHDTKPTAVSCEFRAFERLRSVERKRRTRTKVGCTICPRTTASGARAMNDGQLETPHFSFTSLGYNPELSLTRVGYGTATLVPGNLGMHSYRRNDVGRLPCVAHDHFTS
jgi:hypothetical protein